MSKPPLPLEKDFQKKIVAMAKLYGWRVFHDYDSRRNTAGFPDLVMVRGGYIIFAELKRSPKHKPSKAQIDWLTALVDAEVIASMNQGRPPAVQVFLWDRQDTQGWLEIENALRGH